MKKLVMFSFVFAIIFANHYLFALTETVVYGDIDTNCTTPLGPGFCCIPSSSICIICYSVFPFEQQPYQEHIGLFIPYSSPPQTGQGFTDVNVRQTQLTGGVLKFEYVVNPENVMINNYQEWKSFMQNKFK